MLWASTLRYNPLNFHIARGLWPSFEDNYELYEHMERQYIHPHPALRGNVNINVNWRQGSFLKLARTVLWGSCLFFPFTNYDDSISAQIYSICLSLSSIYYTIANIFFHLFSVLQNADIQDYAFHTCSLISLTTKANNLESSRPIAPPKPHHFSILHYPIFGTINQSLCHPLILDLPIDRQSIPSQASSRYMLTRRIFRTHARQDILPRTQADEEGKRDQPDTDPEIRRHLRKCWHILDIDLVWLAPVTRRSRSR